MLHQRKIPAKGQSNDDIPQRTVFSKVTQLILRALLWCKHN